jgi:hypothetical protein
LNENILKMNVNFYYFIHNVENIIFTLVSPLHYFRLKKVEKENKKKQLVILKLKIWQYIQEA